MTANFRVLVLRNDRADEPHQRIEAICLELNHGGRGSTVPEALEDLAKTLEEYFAEVWKQGASAHYDPDPQWLKAFEGKRAKTADGDAIIDRYRLHVSLERNAGRKKAGAIKRIPTVSFEALVA